MLSADGKVTTCIMVGLYHNKHVRGSCCLHLLW